MVIISEMIARKTKDHDDTNEIHRMSDRPEHVNHVIMIVMKHVNCAGTIRMNGIIRKIQTALIGGTKGYQVSLYSAV